MARGSQSLLDMNPEEFSRLVEGGLLDAEVDTAEIRWSMLPSGQQFHGRNLAELLVEVLGLARMRGEMLNVALSMLRECEATIARQRRQNASLRDEVRATRGFKCR